MGTIYYYEMNSAAIVARMNVTSARQNTKPQGLSRCPHACALAAALLMAGCATGPGPTTKAQQQAITPAQARAKLEAGNARFFTGDTLHRDWRRQLKATAGGQYPFAVVLSCIDSRVPDEIIFDQGLGDIFTVRVAGNVLDDEILGSMEFACKMAGAKLIFVLGHTRCGAIKGACGGAQLGHLTCLLDRIKPSVAAAKEKLPGVPATDEPFAEEVAELNVQSVKKGIREQSPVLRDLIDSGQVGLDTGIYDLKSGKVRFFNH